MFPSNHSNSKKVGKSGESGFLGVHLALCVQKMFLLQNLSVSITKNHFHTKNQINLMIWPREKWKNFNDLVPKKGSGCPEKLYQSKIDKNC